MDFSDLVSLDQFLNEEILDNNLQIENIDNEINNLVKNRELIITALKAVSVILNNK